MGVKSPMTILVVTPIDEEYEAFKNTLAEFGHEGAERSVGRLTAIEYDGGEIILAQGGLGKAQFGVQTQHLIDNLDNIDVVVCAGTCGQTRRLAIRRRRSGRHPDGGARLQSRHDSHQVSAADL